MSHFAEERSARCPICFWSLYDGDWCQGPKWCSNRGKPVEKPIRLTNAEAMEMIRHYCQTCGRHHPCRHCEPLCSASLDVADCCTSLDEARDVIRRREKYANELMAWINERRNAPDSATLEMIQERLLPLCSIPNSKSLG